MPATAPGCRPQSEELHGGHSQSEALEFEQFSGERRCRGKLLNERCPAPSVAWAIPEEMRAQGRITLRGLAWSLPEPGLRL